MTIQHISDTARWTAWYRAMESEREDALFRDPWARKLAGPEGERIVRALPRGTSAAWAMIVRTVLFDELILGVLARQEVDLVVNLAAGLDVRPWRMPLPSSLRWVDVDLPGVLDYKLETMGEVEPGCTYQAVRRNLADESGRREFFAEVVDGASRALVVTEGLLLYLKPDQVGDLARDLHGVPALGWWIIDLASPRLLAFMKRSWGKAADQGNATFHFAPEEGTAFFSPFGWREEEFRSTWVESRRLGREMRGAWLWRFLGRFQSREKREAARRMSGSVLLERSST